MKKSLFIFALMCLVASCFTARAQDVIYRSQVDSIKAKIMTAGIWCVYRF